jgi:hypothetical protein
MSLRRSFLGLALLAVLSGLPIVPAAAAVDASPSRAEPITLPRPESNLNAFGYTVAVSGDTAVVVAIRTVSPPGISEQGQAFIYTVGARGWSPTPVATLKAPAASGQFGTVVALSDSTLVISDPNTTPESVYVYAKGAEGWPTTPNVIETDPEGYPGDRLNDSFGQSLAISGDTLMIGSASVDDNGDGVVYEYTAGSGGWPTTPTLTMTDPGASPSNRINDGFGDSVALSGTTAMIGADGSFGDGQPLVYEFTEGSGGWPASPTVTLPAPQSSDDCFGRTHISISGTTALIAGCLNQYKGAVYAYAETAAGWQQKPVAAFNDPAPKGRNNYFGSALEVSDGRAVIGASGTDDYRGRAYVYAMDDNGSWNTTPVFVLNDRPSGKEYSFGFAVGLSGSTAVIGAPEAGPTSDNVYGLAYLYDV